MTNCLECRSSSSSAASADSFDRDVEWRCKKAGNRSIGIFAESRKIVTSPIWCPLDDGWIGLTKFYQENPKLAIQLKVDFEADITRPCFICGSAPIEDKKKPGYWKNLCRLIGLMPIGTDEKNGVKFRYARPFCSECIMNGRTHEVSEDRIKEVTVEIRRSKRLIHLYLDWQSYPTCPDIDLNQIVEYCCKDMEDFAKTDHFIAKGGSVMLDIGNIRLADEGEEHIWKEVKYCPFCGVEVINKMHHG